MARRGAVALVLAAGAAAALFAPGTGAGAVPVRSGGGMWSSIAAAPERPGLWVCATATDTTVHGDEVAMTVRLAGTVAVLSGRAGDPSHFKALGFADLATLSLVLRRPGWRAATNLLRPAEGAAAGVVRTRPDGFCLARFAAHAAPVALEGTYGGGPHCCWALRVLERGTGGGLRSARRGFGNVPALLHDVGGTSTVVSGDDRFSYAFGSYAESAWPVLATTLHDGAFVDVTRAHLGLVKADATSWWASYKAHPGSPFGTLAAWTADQCELGRSARAWATLAGLGRHGAFEGPTGGGTQWPHGTAYEPALRAFLVRLGYCP